MSIALIGGMDRLESHYISEAEKLGIDLKVFNKPEAGITQKIKNVDAVVIFTGKVSHRAKKEAMNVAKSKNIPVLMCHSCGFAH
jgi:cellobiose-specific phosphotransferase system component IIB